MPIQKRKHNVMNETYGNPDLFKWLLQHQIPPHS